MPTPRFPSTFLILLLSGILCLLSAPARSADLQLSSGSRQNILIELYTSQGCSSCPPAERWLGALQDDPRLWKSIIPVAFHVDYWDYIGWKDHLADPAYSARQRRYHREQAISTVYTPGFVVNGKEWRRWFGLHSLPEESGRGGILSANIHGQQLRVTYLPPKDEQGPFALNIALLGVGLTAEVTRGENAGRKLPQDFVVLQYLTLSPEEARWHTALPALKKPQGGRLAIAIWVQRRDSLTPLQAVGGWLREK